MERKGVGGFLAESSAVGGFERITAMPEIVQQDTYAIERKLFGSLMSSALRQKLNIIAEDCKPALP